MIDPIQSFLAQHGIDPFAAIAAVVVAIILTAATALAMGANASEPPR